MVEQHLDNSYFQESEVIHLRDYIRIIFSRKWLVVAIFLIVMLTAIYYIRTTPPVYKADVTLSYEDRTASQLVFEGISLKKSQVPIEAEQEFLTSPLVVQDIVNYLTPVGPGDSFHLFALQPSINDDDELLKDVVNQRLNIVVDSNQAISLPAPIGYISVEGLPVIQILEVITEKIHRHNNTAKILLSHPKFVMRRTPLVPESHIANTISLSSLRGSSVLYLSATANTAHEAASIANTAAYVYTKQVTEREGQDLDFALGFLRSQMRNVQQLMENSSKELYEFRQEKKLAPSSSSDSADQTSLLDLLGGYYTDLRATSDQIQITQSHLDELDTQLAETKAKIQSSESILTTDMLTDDVTRLRETIENFKLERQVKLETVTEKHSDIVKLNRQIEVTQERLDGLLEQLRNQEGVTTSSISEWDGLVKESISLTMKLQGLRQQEQHLNEKIRKFEAEHPDLISEDLKLIRLDRQVRMHDQQYSDLLSRRDQMTLLREMETGGINILKQARVPKSPIKPRKIMTLFFGAALGVVLGIGSALFLEYMDDSIKRKEDVERELNLEVVATVPKISIPRTAKKSAHELMPQTAHALAPPDRAGPSGNSHSPSGNRSHRSGEATGESRSRHSRGHRKRMEQLIDRLLPNLKSQSQVLESYRTLQSNIQFAAVDAEAKSFLITSAAPGEGKTLTASNLAITMARSEKKVLLVDCDLRRPRQHMVFGCRKQPGLSDALTGNLQELEGEDSNGLIRRTEVDNLDLVPCGSIPPNPIELLNNQKLMHLIEQWQREYDFILLDSPPVVSVADASILATKVDRILLIIKSGQTKRQVAIHARDLLQKVDANIFGVTLNDIDFSKQYGY